MGQKVLLDNNELRLTLHRLCCQLIENHDDFSNTVLIGLQPRGKYLVKRLQQILEEDYNKTNLNVGLLDTTFFRDDFRRRDQPLLANQTDISFLVEGKNVVFVDDVLYTGRSVRAALDAVQSFGRPKEVELLVLIDRRFSRHLPIQPDYVGRTVDTIDSERVTVEWNEAEGNDKVSLLRTENR